MVNCEYCGKEVTNYWGYLSDFYPDIFPARDCSKDMILYVLENDDGLHFYCSEQHCELGLITLG